MAEKKTRRRRSNWYIYLCTFILTSVTLMLVILSMRELLFPEPGSGPQTGAGDYRPDASFNSNFIFMLAETNGEPPEFYLLGNYRPRDDALVIVPLDRRLYSNFGGSLTEIYSSRGAVGIADVVENITGIKCDYYFKFDKISFIDLIDSVGMVTANVPFELSIDERVVFEAGTQRFNGTQVYDYITFPDEFAEDRGRGIIATLAVGFFNDNSRNKTAAELQSYARKIINTTNTNYRMEDFSANQQAYMYTTQYSSNIAESYVPLYDYNPNGQYSIAETSINTLRSRFGMT
ncbi:MAG: LCP family protein [Oscillospiraceae bacterium]|nr:LCP family protein [Oscillospiraceae bacterium]